MVGEFPAGNAHAHYGAELSGAACTVCHSQTTHMDGYVDLIDPDSGSLYRFVKTSDLTSDPDVSDFCAHCHDADGAARLPSPLDPFGNVDVNYGGAVSVDITAGTGTPGATITGGPPSGAPRATTSGARALSGGARCG